MEEPQAKKQKLEDLEEHKNESPADLVPPLKGQ